MRIQTLSSTQLAWTSAQPSLNAWIKDLFVVRRLIIQLVLVCSGRVTGDDHCSSHCSSIWGTGLSFWDGDRGGECLIVLLQCCFPGLTCVFCFRSMAEAPYTWLPTKATLRLCVSCSKLAATWTSRTMWVDSSVFQLGRHLIPARPAVLTGCQWTKYFLLE